MTRRAALTVADSGVYSPIAPAASPIALELVQEYVKDFLQKKKILNYIKLQNNLCCHAKTCLIFAKIDFTVINEQ